MTTIRYTMRITNLGPDPANNAQVEDLFGAGIENITWTCTALDGAVCPNVSGSDDISETIATFPSGGSLTYIVNAGLVNWQGEQNTVTVTAPTGVVDPVIANNWASIRKYLVVLPFVTNK